MRIIKIIIPCLLLNACMFGTSKNAKFYTMAAIPAQVLSTDYKVSVGVARVQLPKYVDRPQIVTQHKNSVQVDISEYNRWIESPSVLATRVLSDNLSELLPSAQIKETRLKSSIFDRIVMVEIIKINAVLGQQAELVAWCTVKDNSGKVHSRQKIERSIDVGKTYDELAQAYSQLLAGLSQEIAALLIKK